MTPRIRVIVVTIYSLLNSYDPLTAISSKERFINISKKCVIYTTCVIDTTCSRFKSLSTLCSVTGFRRARKTCFCCFIASLQSILVRYGCLNMLNISQCMYRRNITSIFVLELLENLKSMFPRYGKLSSH